MLKGHDPQDLLARAAIDPSVYGDVHRAIDGRELFRLVEQIQEALRAPRRAGGGLMLGMLCFVYVLNFLDRQLVSILTKPIQDALDISDGQPPRQPRSIRSATARLPRLPPRSPIMPAT